MLTGVQNKNESKGREKKTETRKRKSMIGKVQRDQ